MIPGIVTGPDVLAQSIKFEMDEEIKMYDPSAMPFTIVLTNMEGGKLVTGTETFNSMQDDLYDRWVRATADSLAAAATVTVNDSTGIQIGTMGKVARTGVMVLVTAVNHTTHVCTISRGATVGETADDDILTGDHIYIGGTAFSEGADWGDAIATKETYDYNYTVTIETPVEISGRHAARKVYGGDTFAKLRKMAGIAHAIRIEWWLLFGERFKATHPVTGKEITGTRGLIRSINSGASGNIKTAAVLQEKDFQEWVTRKLDYYGQGGEGQIFLMCDPIFFEAVAWWSGPKLVIPQDVDTYGVSIKEYVGATDKRVFLHKHRLLENSTIAGGTAGQGYAGYSIGATMSTLKYRFMEGRDTHIEVVPKAGDRYKEVWLTDMGLQHDLPKKSGIYNGVTNYA